MESNASVSFVDLHPDTTYAMQVSACNSLGCSPYGPPEKIKTRKKKEPLKPMSLKVNKITDTSVNIEWFMPYADKNECIKNLGYEVNLSCMDPPGCPSVIKQGCINLDAHVGRYRKHFENNFKENGDATRFHPVKLVIENLSPNTLYEIRVASVRESSRKVYTGDRELVRTKISAPNKVSDLTVQFMDGEHVMIGWRTSGGSDAAISHAELTYIMVTQIEYTNNVTFELNAYDSSNIGAFDSVKCDCSQFSENRFECRATRKVQSPHSNDRWFVTLNEIKAGCYYIIKISAFSAMGSGPTAVIWVNSAEARSIKPGQDNIKSQWQMQHDHCTKYLDKSLVFNGIKLEFVSEPQIGLVQQTNSIYFNISIRLTNLQPDHFADPYFEFRRTSSSLLLKKLKSALWPVQIQSIPTTGYHFGIRELEWEWIESIYSVGLVKSYHKSVNSTIYYLNFRLTRLTSFVYYRFRIWSPIFLAFRESINTAPFDFIRISQASRWIQTDSSSPSKAPIVISILTLNATALQVFWHPLLPSEWHGPPGGYLITAIPVEKETSTSTRPCQTRFEPPSSMDGKSEVWVSNPYENTGILHQLKPSTTYTIRLQAFNWFMDNPDEHQTPNHSIVRLGPMSNSRNSSISFIQCSPKIGRTLDTGPNKTIENIMITNVGDKLLLEWDEDGHGYEDHDFEVQIKSSIMQPQLLLNDLEELKYSKLITLGEPNLFTKVHQVSETVHRKIDLANFAYQYTDFLTTEFCIRPYSTHYWLRMKMVNRYGTGPQTNWFHLRSEKWMDYGVLQLKKVLIPKMDNKTSSMGRAVISWSFDHPPANLMGSQHQITWFPVNPVTLVQLGRRHIRKIRWPDTKSTPSKAELVISVDKLTTGHVYEIIIEPKFGGNQSCSMSLNVVADIIPTSRRSPPHRKPTSPVQWIQGENTPHYEAEIDSNNCRSASVTLAWPRYLSSLAKKQSLDGEFGVMYTAPVRNYSLQYSFQCYINDNKSVHGHCHSESWKQYRLSPLVGQESGFTINHLLPSAAYMFRLAARTDAGMSPYSLPSSIIYTPSKPPCARPKSIVSQSLWISPSELYKYYGRDFEYPGEGDVESSCQTIGIGWQALSNDHWHWKPGRYIVEFLPWPSTNRLVKYETITVITTLKQTSLYVIIYAPTLEPNRYYEVSISALNDAGRGPPSRMFLVHSGYGCIGWEKTWNRAVWEVETVGHVRRDIHSLVKQFNCQSSQEHIVITCWWQTNLRPSSLGYRLLLKSSGSLDKNLGSNQLYSQNNQSIFVPFNTSSIRLGTILQLQAPNKWKMVLNPYHCYLIEFEILDMYQPNAHDHIEEIHEKILNRMFQENKAVPKYICTTQWIPNKPTNLHVHWMSREQVELQWEAPNQLNGQLIAYGLEVKSLPSGNNPSAKQTDTSDLTIIPPTTSRWRFLVAMNSVHLIEFKARTGAAWNKGWGPASCLMISTDPCVSMGIMKLVTDGKECSHMRKFTEFFQKQESKTCQRYLPKIYRPTLHLINSVTQSKPQRIAPSNYDGRNKLDDSSRDKVLKINWDVMHRGSLAIDKFILEVRFSTRLSNWIHLATLNHSVREHHVNLKNLSQLRVTLESTSLGINYDDLERNLDEQMIIASFAQKGIVSDSSNHVAIQIRLIAAAEFLLDSPGPTSDWIVLDVGFPQHSIYKHNWFWILVCISILLPLLITLLLVILYRLCAWRLSSKSQFFIRKLVSQPKSDQLFDCCYANPNIQEQHDTPIAGTGRNNVVPTISVNHGSICSWDDAVPTTCLQTSVYGLPNTPSLDETEMNTFTNSPDNWGLDDLLDVQLQQQSFVAIPTSFIDPVRGVVCRPPSQRKACSGHNCAYKTNNPVHIGHSTPEFVTLNTFYTHRKQPVPSVQLSDCGKLNQHAGSFSSSHNRPKYTVKRTNSYLQNQCGQKLAQFSKGSCSFEDSDYGYKLHLNPTNGMYDVELPIHSSGLTQQIPAIRAGNLLRDSPLRLISPNNSSDPENYPPQIAPRQKTDVLLNNNPILMSTLDTSELQMIPSHPHEDPMACMTNRSWEKCDYFTA